ncbi:adenylate kinase family protein [Candidatus Woesearchaeota archaeon]|nr:adenylate kinase family protein [Candidatus Woesearchaeota archaeon]
MRVILVTGTPCTGKTTYAKKFAEKQSYKYVDVNTIIQEHKLKEHYDRKRRCYVIDTDRLNKALIKLIKDTKGKEKGLVIDSHLSHHLPKQYVDLCIVTKCSLKELKNRLQKRHYPKSKIEENLQAEIFEVCLTEAKEQGHKIKIVDTSSGI